MRLFGDFHGKSLVLLFGFVLLYWAPLWYLFGTAKSHNRPRAISKITKWVPIVLLIVLRLWEGLVFIQFLWLHEFPCNSSAPSFWDSSFNV